MSKRWAVCCVTVICLAVGVLIGQRLVRRDKRTEVERTVVDRENDSRSEIRSSSKSPPTTTNSPLQNVEAFLASGKSKPMPGQLPLSQNAVPIPQPLSNAVKPSPAKTSPSSLREIIQQELPHATPEEIATWENTLRGLSPHMARNLLEMRRSHGSLLNKPKAGIPHMPSEQKPLFQATRPAIPQRVKTTEQPWDVPPQYAVMFRAIHKAQMALLNNLANTLSPGYKRIRASVGGQFGNGIQLGKQMTKPESPGTDWVRDWSQGSLRETQRKLDIAVKGDGFFQLRLSEKILLTRYGRFTLNAKRELGMRIGSSFALLEPAIVIPAEATDIEFSTQGIVTIRMPGNPSPVVVGQLQLARVLNPDGLSTRDGVFFEQTAQSGKPLLGQPAGESFGQIGQAVLESSNSNRERELAEIHKLVEQQHVMRQALQMIHSLTDEFHHEQTAHRRMILSRQNPNRKPERNRNHPVPEPRDVFQKDDWWKKSIDKNDLKAIENDLGLRP